MSSAASDLFANAPSLSALYKHLEDDLARFYRELRDRLRSDVFLIDQGVRYLIKSKGKALRPFLVLASARLFGPPNDLTFRAAMIVELLHTATLVHDDVVDEANVRRGLPSFNKIWGNKFAVLFGDYLLSHSLIATLEKGRIEVVSLLADTARQMVQGQLKELAQSRKPELSSERYYSIIGDKTASLIRTCAELGMVTMDRAEAEREALARYGQNVGIAFQIRDDILDVTGRGKLLGKPVGKDLREGKFTLPLVLALEASETSERNQVVKKLKRRERGGRVDFALEFIRRHRGVELAQKQAEDYAAAAVSALGNVGDENHRQVLIEFARISAVRNR